MDKRSVRQYCTAYRKHLAAREYVGLCQQIAANLAELKELKAARVFHAYWPNLSMREVDIRPVLSYLRALGHTIGFPVVDFASAEPRLIHRIWDSEQAMIRNRWGIMEPVSGADLPLDEVDVVLVPALGLDHRGSRVGFGKGYYDRFLAHLDALFVSPIFGACVMERIKTAPHDVSMDVSVTEHAVNRHTDSLPS